MKKLLVGSFIALAAILIPFSQVHAQEIPACGISVDPTLHYDTAYFACEPYTNPVTGETYNAIYIGVPHP